MKKGIFLLIDKILDIFKKTSKNGEKSQELEEKRINTYSKLIYVLTAVALFMCVLASLFPSLAIPEWWFEIFEKLIKGIN